MAKSNESDEIFEESGTSTASSSQIYSTTSEWMSSSLLGSLGVKMDASLDERMMGLAEGKPVRRIWQLYVKND